MLNDFIVEYSSSRPGTVNGGTDDPMELGHGRLPAANSNGHVELKEVRASLTAVHG